MFMAMNKLEAHKAKEVKLLCTVSNNIQMLAIKLHQRSCLLEPPGIPGQGEFSYGNWHGKDCKTGIPGRPGQQVHSLTLALIKYSHCNNEQHSNNILFFKTIFQIIHFSFDITFLE